MSCFTLTFPGPPVPLARPRFSKKGTYDCQKHLKDEYAWHIFCQKDSFKKIKGAIEMHVTFHMQIPESSSKKVKRDLLWSHHTKRPDLSNLIKFVEDAMQGSVFDDDSQIVAIKAHKKYSEEPKTVVKIWDLEFPMEE